MSQLEKAKKPRTQKQIEATEKLVARNKQKRAEKLALKNNPVPDTTAVEVAESPSINEVVPDSPSINDLVPDKTESPSINDLVITKPKRKYVKKPKPPPEPEPEPEPEPDKTESPSINDKTESPSINDKTDSDKHYSNYLSDHSDSLSDSYSDDEIPIIQKPPPVKKMLKVPRRFRVN